MSADKERIAELERKLAEQQVEIDRMHNRSAFKAGYNYREREQNEELNNLLAKAKEEEREACAEIVENADYPDCGGWSSVGIAESIRKRHTAPKQQGETK